MHYCGGDQPPAISDERKQRRSPVCQSRSQNTERSKVWTSSVPTATVPRSRLKAQGNEVFLLNGAPLPLLQVKVVQLKGIPGSFRWLFEGDERGKRRSAYRHRTAAARKENASRRI